MPLSSQPQPTPASLTLAALILSHAGARDFLAWAETVRLNGEVYVDGERWEPIPVAEVTESSFAAFDEARS